MKFNYKTNTLLLVSSLALTACGGGSSSDNNTSVPTPGGGGTPTTPVASTGIFSDSPVAGVAYTTSPGGLSGITTALGEYDYEDGDKVRFSIGGINFPEVTAKGEVTPLDMGGEDATLETASVLNVIRLLQTLDADGDPENGITIAETTATALQDTVVDFTAITFESEAATAVDAAFPDEDRVLVSADEAKSHFEGTLNSGLKGSWKLVEAGGGVNVLTFFGNNRYVIAHSAEDDNDQPAGSAEYGVYTWDPVSGDFNIERVIDETDGAGGLYDSESFDPEAAIRMTLADNQLTMDFSEEQVVFDAITGDAAHIGAWYLLDGVKDNDPKGGALITFIDESHYVLVHTYNQESYEDVAEEDIPRATSEWNTYSYNADTKALTIGEATAEMDGDGGLYDKDATEGEKPAITMELKNNGDLVLLFNGEEDDSTFARVGSFETILMAQTDGAMSSAPVKRAFPFHADSNSEGNYLIIDLGLNDEMAYLELEFDAGVGGEEDSRTGTMYFFFEGDDEATGENEILNWEISSSGVLHILETDGEVEANWTITPIAGKAGNAVLLEQDDIDWSFITSMESDAYEGFSASDLRSIINVFYEDDDEVEGQGEAILNPMSFNMNSGAFVVTDSEGEKHSGEFGLFMSNRVIQLAFAETPDRFNYIVFKEYAEDADDGGGSLEHYNGYFVCWVDDEEAQTPEEAHAYAPNCSIEYLAIDAESAEIARTSINSAMP